MLILSMMCGSSVALAISTANPASAAGEQVVVGMPFAGKWAYNATVYPDGNGNYSDSTSSHPTVHWTKASTSTLWGDWATDLYPTMTGANVKLKLSVPSGTSQPTLSWGSATSPCSGQAARVVNVSVGGTPVGSIYFTHLGSAASMTTPPTNGMVVGTTAAPVCNPGPHIHFELKNATNHSCYVDWGNPGKLLAEGDAIGVLGASNSSTRQPCSSVPSPNTTAIANDFNGDGKADLAWHESWNSGSVKVITDKAGAPSSAWTTGYSTPGWAGVGNFGGDTKADIAWYDPANGGAIKVLITNSSGTGFSSAATWSTGFGQPGWAGVGDFAGATNANGANYDDIAWYDPSVGAIKVLVTNSAGNGFASANTWSSGFSTPSWAGVGNFTLDGKADIAWYESWNNGGTIKILATSGNGFASANAWSSGFGQPGWAGVGDFTLGEYDDIAWYDPSVGGGSIKVFATSNSGSNFASVNTWSTGYSDPSFAGAANFNGEGYDDIAWYESWNNRGTIKLLVTNSGGSNFASANTWRSGYSAPSWAGPGSF